MLDPTITSVFVTPNQPRYPSAHLCLTGSVSTVLGQFFPRDAENFAALANQTSEARIMGGIHFRTDLEVGLALGRQVANVILSRADAGGAPAQ